MDLMVNPVITGFRQDVDGTIKELKIGSNKEDAYANIIEQGASAKLDNNKTATIDVSAYTEPVVINPTSGKDGMKKATITLSNIPSPGTSFTLYAWKAENHSLIWTLSATPSVGDNAYEESDSPEVPDLLGTPLSVASVGEGTITAEETTYTRFSDKDITVTKS